MLSARNGHLEVVKWLIKEGGAKVDERDDNDNTALLLAVVCGQLEVVKWLVKEGGAKVDKKNKYGHTALLLAVVCGQLEVVKWLVKEGGAKVDEKNKYGHTALLLAAQNGELEVVKWLLSKGIAKINEKNKDGHTALLLAAQNGELEVVKWLIKEGGAKLHERDTTGSTPLIFAAINGELEVVKWLIKENAANTDEKDKDGDTSLLLAAKNGQIEVIKWLIKEGGAKIDERNKNSETALLCAAYNKQLEVVKWLLSEGGARIDEKDKDGNTALLNIAFRGDLEGVKWLIIEGGANIDEKNHRGATALMFAALIGEINVVKWLIQECGAKDFDVENKFGDSALSFAARYGHQAVVDWFYEWKRVTQILETIESGNITQLRKFDKEELLKFIDGKGNTALHIAIAKNNREIVDYLLQIGMNILVTNKHGENLLQIAERYEYVDLIELLIERGCTSRAQATTEYMSLHKTTQLSSTSFGGTFFSVNQKNNTPVNIPGLAYQKVDGDGNCFYYSIAYYLADKLTGTKNHKELRKIVADYLDRNLKDESVAVGIKAQLPQGKSIKDYIASIRDGNEWADDLEITMVMNLFKRPIIIIDSNNRITNLSEIKRLIGEPIFIYYNGINHYDALIRTGEVTNENIMDYLLQFNVMNKPACK